MGSEAGSTGRECKYCGSSLPVRAIYCVNCKRYESGWRQAFSQFSIAGLISIISVGTLAAGAIRNWVILPNSRVHGHILSCTPESLAMVFANTGNREAIIDGGVITRTFAGKSDTDSLTLKAAESDVILMGGKSEPVHFTFQFEGNDGESFQLKYPHVPCSYHVTVNVLDFNDRAQPVKGDCGCVAAPE